MEKFSILTAIFYGEDPEAFTECLKSLSSQTHQADEIILVKDGPLTPELEKIITKWKKTLPIKTVGYDFNKGLGYALNYGIHYCSNEIIARVDADDIYLPTRQEEQFTYLVDNPNIVAVGSYIGEFNETPNDINSIRKCPSLPHEIKKYIKSRCPMNHPSVMFRKSCIMAVGSYETMHGFEDYYLWFKLIKADYELANIPKVLVNVRIGNNMVRRRHGFTYARKELGFYTKVLSRKMISFFQYIKIISIRIPLRLLPLALLTKFYKLLRR